MLLVELEHLGLLYENFSCGGCNYHGQLLICDVKCMLVNNCLCVELEHLGLLYENLSCGVVTVEDNY